MSKKANGKKVTPETIPDAYLISSDRPIPGSRHERSSRLEATMSIMKPGDSFDMPVADWYALKAKLNTNPGVYTYRKNKATSTLTVWKR
jgi:hypothetical protein